jgi:hypothetical protein
MNQQQYELNRILLVTKMQQELNPETTIQNNASEEQDKNCW